MVEMDFKVLCCSVLLLSSLEDLSQSAGQQLRFILSSVGFDLVWIPVELCS